MPPGAYAIFKKRKNEKGIFRARVEPKAKYRLSGNDVLDASDYIKIEFCF